MRKSVTRKTLGMLAVLSTVVVGGVYATWTYTNSPEDVSGNVDVILGEFEYVSSEVVPSVEQQEAVEAFLAVLNTPAANDELQEIVDYYDNSRNYINGDDVISRYNSWFAGIDNRLIYELGNQEGYYIIKFDTNESKNGKATSFVMFSTPNVVEGKNGQMVTDVYKSIFAIENGEYVEKACVKGCAPYAYDNTLRSGSYNTDLWAKEIVENTYYAANLNTNVDGDPSTVVNYNTNNTNLGNFVHYAFTAKENGSYTITTDKACTIGVYKNLADGNWGASLENDTYKVAGSLDATATTLTFTATANTTYYIRLTMPRPANGDYNTYTSDYNVQMYIVKS